MTEHTDSIMQRVYKAICTTQADHIPIDRFTVYVHPETFNEVRASVPQVEMYVAVIGEHRLFGLPIERDATLTPGDIVLRYEVKA